MSELLSLHDVWSKKVPERRQDIPSLANLGTRNRCDSKVFLASKTLESGATKSPFDLALILGNSGRYQGHPVVRIGLFHFLQTYIVISRKLYHRREEMSAFGSKLDSTMKPFGHSIPAPICNK